MRRAPAPSAIALDRVHFWAGGFSAQAARQTRPRMSDSCAAQCREGCLSTTLQIFLGIACVLVSLWIASLLLEWVNLIGITSIPPGVKYTDYRATG